MIAFQGTYFDGNSSKAHAVHIVCSGGFVSVRNDAHSLRVDVKLDELSLAPPLGKARRVLELPGGARCETSDLEAVRQLEALQGSKPRGMQLVHQLESHWVLVITCAVGLLLGLWGLMAQGIPWMAKRAAFATPKPLIDTISKRSLDVLDKQLFTPSRLTPDRAERLQQHFQTVIQNSGSAAHARLMFRRSPNMGANALALPSGLVIMTDELVHLAENDRELIGIMAHELAHVQQQHGLRNVYQSTGIFLLISILLGDVTSMTSAAASLPTLLIESGYSRQFETAADTFAGRYMIQRGWGTKPLRNILQRISGEHGKKWPTFLATHPGTQERLRHLEAMERGGGD